MGWKIRFESTAWCHIRTFATDANLALFRLQSIGLCPRSMADGLVSRLSQPLIVITNNTKV
jgi:hypothetical protein